MILYYVALYSFYYTKKLKGDVYLKTRLKGSDLIDIGKEIGSYPSNGSIVIITLKAD